MTDLTPAVTQASFQQEVVDASQDQPVLVDFWAAWCGPCKSLAPILERLAEEFAGRARVVKVDTDAEQALAAQYGIRSLPTVMVFRDGKPVDQIVGLQPEGGLRTLIGKWLAKPSDAQRAESRARLAAGDAAGALALLEAVLAQEPDNVDVRVEWIEALAAGGRLDEAREALNGLPFGALDAPRLAAAQARLHFVGCLQGAPTLEDARRRAEADPNDLAAVHALGVRELALGQVESALERFASVMQRDRRYGDDLGRQSLLHAFALLEGRDDLVHQYRRRIATLMH
jgi:putative thioredoxin